MAMETKRDMCICPNCGVGHNKAERQIALYRGMAIALWKVYLLCKDTGVHEFSRKDVKHLFVSENETARFGDWVMFGGLVYKLKKGRYGLNMERCEKFFNNTYSIPTILWKNPITGEVRKEEYQTVKRIPSLLKYLNEQHAYVVNYKGLE